MNPLHLTATNYRTFESLDVDLPSGCVAVVGPNGAGKSSILNLIDVALFAERGELAPLLTVGEEDLELTLTFEHAGDLYRVRRQYSARGRGKTTCDFEIRRGANPHLAGIAMDFDGGRIEIASDGSGWEPLTRENADATAKLICDTLGLSRATFRASSFLRQGDGAAFTEAQPRDRKAILAEILGLDVWDRLLDRARSELRGCEDALVKSRAQIEGLDELVAAKPAVEALVLAGRANVAAAEATLADGEQQLEEAQRELSAADVLAEQIRACEAELQTATDAHTLAVESFSTATRAAHDLADRQVELGELAADADRVPQLELDVARLRAAATDASNAMLERRQLADDAERRDLARARMVEQGLRLHQDAMDLRGKATHLEEHIDESASCNVCGQTLGAEAAARAAASYRGDADRLDEQARQVDETAEAKLGEIARLRERADAIEIPEVADPEPVERDLAACRRAAEQRAALAEKVAQLTALAERREELEQRTAETGRVVAEKQQALDKAKETVVNLDVLQAKVERWRIAVSEARRLIESRRADLVRGETQLEQIAQAERTLADHTAAVETISRRVDLLKLAEKAYGRDGIPALIVENAAIPQLELEANRILGELGGATAGCRIELRTQRALKSAADQLRETLDIVIVTPTGARAYETFSGGERTRLNLALRIALARLLAHRRGAESRLLAIDEPDGLDQAGMQALANVLRGVGGDFEKVLVVSHHPDLATELEQSIVVVSDGERSRVDAGAEAVAA